MFKSQHVLIKFDDPRDTWTVDDAMRGTSIIGGTGSGKTSASGRLIAKQFLKQGWGGVVLCAKSDEARLWEEYCIDTGRYNDMIVFEKGAKHKEGKFKDKDIIFNAIDYEMKREGEGAGETQNIVNIFMNIHRMGTKISGEQEGKDDRFWDTSLKRCLNKTIELIKLAGEDLTYRNMVKIINTCNNITNKDVRFAAKKLRDKQEVEGFNESSNYCFKCLVNALIKSEYSDEFTFIEDYFITNLPSVGEKTKATILEMFTAISEPFLSGLLAKHFAGETNIYPEEVYKENKILILNFPIKEYLDAGIIAQSIFKLLFQQAMERRNVDEFPTPVFLFADEAQYFVNLYDQIFLTTARSSRTATVFLSQNIPNYYVSMGGDKESESKVDSLMGNLSTKIFHTNSDATTNEYASKLIGDDLEFTPSVEYSNKPNELYKEAHESRGADYLPQVQPKEFTTLKTGGSNHNYEVEAIMMVAGRKWSDGKNYINICFDQEFKNKWE